jgi:hypothetical protein
MDTETVLRNATPYQSSNDDYGAHNALRLPRSTGHRTPHRQEREIDQGEPPNHSCQSDEPGDRRMEPPHNEAGDQRNGRDLSDHDPTEPRCRTGEFDTTVCLLNPGGIQQGKEHEGETDEA